MTPEAKVRFYKAMYRAKCEQYDALIREVDLLLEPEAVFTDGTPVPPKCDCGQVPRSVMNQTGMYVLNGVVHNLGAPCYHAGTR